ncbi:hypothetical protein A0J61_03518 [Choanephora cucurbitarum]|uniref:Uncharacterized protein n=1 Tax=Choanephora cucurbitarum TaxID=101091 RepID=A0A1C7NI52_9FUNG|nr:hypothetical protein A0J61_03518 [Choanephora cucurbitarum]
MQETPPSKKSIQIDERIDICSYPSLHDPQPLSPMIHSPSLEKVYQIAKLLSSPSSPATPLEEWVFKEHVEDKQ